MSRSYAEPHQRVAQNNFDSALLSFVVSKNEERCQNPKPKTRKPNPNPREENGKKKRTGREKKGNGSFPILNGQHVRALP